MSGNDDWQGDAPQPVRRGPPKWMVFTGCGCLIPGFLGVSVLAWGMQFFGAATNPMKSYAALAEVLPFDERLKGRETGLADDPGTRALESHEAPEFALFFGAEFPFSDGLKMYYLARGVSAVDGKLTYADDALIAILAWVPTEQSGPAMRGNGEGEPIRVDVQGVELAGLSFASIESQIILDFPKGTASVTGPGVALRLRSDVADDPEDPKSTHFDLLLTLQRAHPSAPPVTDEDVRTFLAPFHVGPNR